MPVSRMLSSQRPSKSQRVTRLIPRGLINSSFSTSQIVLVHVFCAIRYDHKAYSSITSLVAHCRHFLYRTKNTKCARTSGIIRQVVGKLIDMDMIRPVNGKLFATLEGMKMANVYPR